LNNGADLPAGLRRVQADSAAPLDIPRDATLRIFDFCGTLFDCNTTLAFLRYVAASCPAAFSIRFHALRCAASLLRRARLAGPRTFMRIRLVTLKGMTRPEIESAADRFVETTLPGHVRPPVFEAFSREIADQSRVVLASRTLDIILAAFVRRYPVEKRLGLSADYGSGDVCTGRYAPGELETGKLARLRADYSEDDLRGSFFVTDNPETDRDLLTCVRYPVLLEDT
jgi:phosphoserine phosphatase